MNSFIVNLKAKRSRQIRSGVIEKTPKTSLVKQSLIFGRADALLLILKKYTAHGSIFIVIIFFSLINLYLGNKGFVGGAIASETISQSEQKINLDDFRDLISKINVYAKLPQDLAPAENLRPALVGGTFIIKPASADTEVSTLIRDEFINHAVEEGETLWTIAYKYELNIDTLRWANKIDDPNNLKVGSIITVPPVNGMVYMTKNGDTLIRIASSWGVTTADLKKFNSLNSDEITPDKQLVIPGARPVVAAPVYTYYSSATKAYDGIITPGTGNFIWPIASSSRFITQYFSWYHSGIDADWRNGSVIIAADTGTVVAANWGWGGGYGNHIIIDHGNGYQTLYGHLSSISVAVGETVGQGQVIGVMGSTGNSTGPHLHFEVRNNGRALNPFNFVK